ncbi:glycosyltransferase family A protein [Petroclostridium sp. X23]|uniref:glycosyltransferase family A protein n=1 Tax=Petroclostridium sp. X23 TaxID=3045146 RepID=UPI0024ADC6DB|nr:glycosyltransferase family A protein [Petroclostridium sp. X23]WHH57481.1 glycosyltransferase family A protein [Petroclostridium sp. X23]
MWIKDFVTIVTPTYNRAYILNNCYECLKLQTNKSFTWMIIDDGSTDNTEELVGKWKNEQVVNIVYYKKDNGGKASALNMALDKVHTDYFVCLDSDDTFTPNAIELALNQLQEVKESSKFCGILALRNTVSGEVIGRKRIPSEVTESTIMDITDKYKIRSEFIQFYKTNVISQYRFPQLPREKFISPEYIAREINRKYKFKVSQDSLCICEYLHDGLTRNKRSVIKKNPKGYTLIKRQSYELAKGFIPKSKHAIMYIAGCILSRDKGCINNSPHKIMTVLYYPIGWLVCKIRFRNI